MVRSRLAVFSLPLALLVPSAAGQTAAGGHGLPAAQRPAKVVPGNVLMVVLDDVGPDMLEVYGVGTDLPPTPTFNALAADGVLFRRAYSNPAGSVTMATLETGRLGEQTGIGFTIYSSVDDFPLPLSEITLPEMLDLGTGGAYAHAMIGKWFLGKEESVGGLSAPNVMGYGHYAGVMEQLYIGGYDYFTYPWVTNGVADISTVYATTHTVDAALDFIEAQTGPWFCHVAFNSAHTPYHEPPAGLHTQILPPVINPHGDLRPWYKAMVESLDTEIGRLLDTLAPEVRARTTVILLTDNGTPQGTVAPPFPSDHGKLTVYEGGINIPLIISGYRVKAPGREVQALVQTTDLFATVGELAGVDVGAALPGVPLHSLSMLRYLEDPAAPALRDKIFAEVFHPNGLGTTVFNAQNYAARNDRYKLIQIQVATGMPFAEKLFDLWADPYEQQNLLHSTLTPEQLAAYNELLAHIIALVAL
jgi:arylsulfatase A-like enzyme